MSPQAHLAMSEDRFAVMTEGAVSGEKPEMLVSIVPHSKQRWEPTCHGSLREEGLGVWFHVYIAGIQQVGNITDQVLNKYLLNERST